MKKLLINQPSGIGDILFIQKIVKEYAKKYEVFLPVKRSIDWIPSYVSTTCKFEDIVDIKFDNVLNLDGCSRGTPYKIMEAKYVTAGISISNYMDYIDISRNQEKEQSLYNLLVGGTTEYRLVNDMFATPEEGTLQTLKMNVERSSKIKNIEMSILDGYSLFDWIKIIQNASEIYTTDSAIMFLIEKYKCKASEFVCYSRRPNSSEIDYLFKKNWRYVV
jgi:hypothetical protein